MKNKIQALRQCPLFSYISKESFDKISGIARFKGFCKNDSIFQEGDDALGFFVVIKGKVKVYKLSVSGAEHILHVVHEGGSIAEAVVFGNMTRYPAFAEALGETEVLFIPKKDFLSLMRSDFSLTLSVLGSMSEKLRYFNALIEELSLKGADARLAKYLLDLSLKRKSESFSLDVKKVELAKRLGIAPETLSRNFKKLVKKHLLRVSRDQITLLDKETLQDISSGEKI
jgi:CRP/FNR family transcriptional regulator